MCLCVRVCRNGTPLGEAFTGVTGPLVPAATLASEESKVTIQNRPTVLNTGEYTGELRYVHTHTRPVVPHSSMMHTKAVSAICAVSYQLSVSDPCSVFSCSVHTEGARTCKETRMWSCVLCRWDEARAGKDLNVIDGLTVTKIANEGGDYATVLGTLCLASGQHSWNVYINHVEDSNLFIGKHPGMHTLFCL